MTEITLKNDIKKALSVLSESGLSPLTLPVVLASIIGSLTAINGYTENELMDMITVVAKESFNEAQKNMS